MPAIHCPPLPDDTARAAEAVFGRDHPYLRMGESLEGLWDRLDLSALECGDGELSGCFYPYALATVLQYWEDLTDRQMSDATRARLDLRYAMHLDLSGRGIGALRLCAFRQLIMASQAGTDALQGLVDGLAGFGTPEKSPADVDRIMAAICLQSRAEIIFESMSAAIEALATRDPGWLKTNTQPHWFRRYHRKLGQPKIPRNRRDIEYLVESVGRDGRNLLAVLEPSARSKLTQLPELLNLRREWERQFEPGTTQLKLREPHCHLCGVNFRSMNDHPQQSEGEPIWKN